MKTADDSTSARQEPHPARWFQRVVPVTALLVVLVCVLAAVSPQLRSQLRLSMTREPESYVDLYFAQVARGTLEGGQVTCARERSGVVADFVVRSHLSAPDGVRYQVTVDPLKQGVPSRSRVGEVQLDPGRSSTVRTTLPLAPKMRYVLTVRLPGRTELLRARCGFGESA